MLPIEIRSLSDDVSESPLGIREPAQGMPFPVGNIDMVIVPGLGFDKNGNRIGRGRGLDRFLAHRDWKGVACGFALEDQVVDEVPALEHDMQVDMLVTDATIRRFPKHRPRSSRNRRWADEIRSPPREHGGTEKRGNRQGASAQGKKEGGERETC